MSGLGEVVGGRCSGMKPLGYTAAWSSSAVQKIVHKMNITDASTNVASSILFLTKISLITNVYEKRVKEILN